MNIIRRAVLALTLIAGISPAIAQAPPVPALPDTERRTSYSITASTCACAVGFQLYGDSTDYANWLEVYVNGVLTPQSGNWTISSPTGSLATIPRPITDAVLTFTAAQTGTIQIVGARRPRRTSQFQESQPVPTRNFNQVFSDIIATQREFWDKTNDFTGRAILGLPGETLTLLPPAATRAGKFMTFDGAGNPGVTAPPGGGGGVTGVGPTVVGHLVTWADTAATVIQDGGAVPSSFTTRVAAIATSIPASVTTVVTNGYATAGDGGGATYVKLASPPTPKAWHFQSVDGAWWQQVTAAVLPKQVGAVLDGTTDDSTAMQAWLDYGSTFGVPSMGQSGTAAIATASLNLLSNETVDGLGVLTIKRTSNVVGSLLGCNDANSSPQSGITVRNMAFSTTAGFSSVSSNTIGLTTQNYTVPAGLVGLVVNNFVQITANSSSAAHVNYMIARINSYSGTTLNVTATTAVGSGTFASWLIDVYPINGNLAASNIALRFTVCSNVVAERNTITGRFYNALDSRNGNDVVFTRNIISGYVNRGIHAAAYNAAAGAINNQVTYNHLQGSSFSQYGVNISATDGAVAAGVVIHGNRIEGTTYQGIILGGGVTSSEISNNSIQMAFNTNGVGVIIENLVGTSGNQLPQTITVNHNNITSGLQGIYATNIFYCPITGNTVTGAGIGILLQGTTANQTLYNTLTGNVVQSSTSHGYQFTGSSANGVFGTAAIGNTSIGNGGWGFISDANTGSSNYSANVSIGNSSGAYSFAGAGNVTTGGNL